MPGGGRNGLRAPFPRMVDKPVDDQADALVGRGWNVLIFVNWIPILLYRCSIYDRRGYVRRGPFFGQ